MELSVDILRPGNKTEAAALYWRMKAEHRADKIRAEAFMAATGPIEERKNKAILNPDYQNALEEVAKTSGAHRQAIHDKEGAKTIIEIWEQEGHNSRALDRLR